MRADESDASARVIGRLVALAGLIVTSPVLAVAAVAIRLSSRGPVLFRARRTGRGGRTFTMFKLRTMHENGDAGGRITAGSDARVFAAGRWLRRFKLDELPQLLNVVSGDMAIVGPRPEDPTIVRDHYTPFMMASLDVPPGLTSPGSLAFYAEEAALPSSPEEAEREYLERILPRKIALDLVYVRHRSPRYDLQLVARTLASIVGGHSVFESQRNWELAQADRILRDAGVTIPGLEDRR